MSVSAPPSGDFLSGEAAPPTPSVQRPSLAVLIAVTALGPMALNIFIPAMPGMVAVFATDYATIQLTLTLYLFGIAVAQPVFGPLSDRFGRRPVLLVGISLFLLGSLAAALADSIGQLIAARVLQAVGGCAGLVLGRAIVRDTHSREESASMIGYITMAMVIAPMLAPLVGGHIDTLLGWRAIFYAVLAVGAVVLIFAWLQLTETNHQRHSGADPLTMLRGFGVLLRDPCFVSYVINISFTAAVFFAFLAGAPYFMVEILDRPSSDYGEYFILTAASYILGNFASGRLSTRLGPERMILTGSLLTLAGVMLIATLALMTPLVPMAVFGPMMLAGLGNGLSLPNATAAAISVRPDLAGTAAGLVGFLQMTVGALSTLVVGALQDDTVFPMVAVMCVGAVLALSGCLLGRAALARRRAAAPQESA